MNLIFFKNILIPNVFGLIFLGTRHYLSHAFFKQDVFKMLISLPKILPSSTKALYFGADKNREKNTKETEPNTRQVVYRGTRDGRETQNDTFEKVKSKWVGQQIDPATLSKVSGASSGATPEEISKRDADARRLQEEEDGRILQRLTTELKRLGEEERLYENAHSTPAIRAYLDKAKRDTQAGKKKAKLIGQDITLQFYYDQMKAHELYPESRIEQTNKQKREVLSQLRELSSRQDRQFEATVNKVAKQIIPQTRSIEASGFSLQKVLGNVQRVKFPSGRVVSKKEFDEIWMSNDLIEKLKSEEDKELFRYIGPKLQNSVQDQVSRIQAGMELLHPR